MLIYEWGPFLESHAQCILFHQSLRANETKFYSICYSNAFHICSWNSCFLWFFLTMCRAHATKRDFNVFHLLDITDITFAWVFYIRTFRVSYFLRRHSNWPDSFTTYVKKHFCCLHLSVWSVTFVLWFNHSCIWEKKYGFNELFLQHPFIHSLISSLYPTVFVGESLDVVRRMFKGANMVTL